MASSRLTEFVKKEYLPLHPLFFVSLPLSLSQSTIAYLQCLHQHYAYSRVSLFLIRRRGIFKRIWTSSFVCQTNSHKFPSTGRNHNQCGDLDLSVLSVYTIRDLHLINTLFFACVLSSMTRDEYRDLFTR